MVMSKEPSPCYILVTYSRKGKVIISDAETERFIELVKKQPAIYECTRPDHMDALVMENIWRGIAEKMEIPDMSGQDWKKKWKSIVDCFRKHRKRCIDKKSGDAARPNRPYKFAYILSFLEKYTSENNTQSNVTPLSDEVDSGDDSMERSAVTPVNASFGLDSESVSSMSSVTHKPRRRCPSPLQEGYDSDRTLSPESIQENPRKKRRLASRRRRSVTPEGERSLQNALTGFIVESTKSRREAQETVKSADELLFANYAIRLKQLPSNLQPFVKLQISQIFFNAENRESTIPITPLPERTQVVAPTSSYLSNQPSEWRFQSCPSFLGLE